MKLVLPYITMNSIGILSPDKKHWWQFFHNTSNWKSSWVLDFPTSNLRTEELARRADECDTFEIRAEGTFSPKYFWLYPSTSFWFHRFFSQKKLKLSKEIKNIKKYFRRLRPAVRSAGEFQRSLVIIKTNIPNTPWTLPQKRYPLLVCNLFWNNVKLSIFHLKDTIPLVVLKIL